MIFLTSDLHFCHNKEFLYAPRGFDNVNDMNDAIVENWNNVVNPEDDVYLLGDVILNDNDLGLKLLKSLKGNIHLALGNHDTDNRIQLYNSCWNIVEIECAYRLRYSGYHFFLTHYPCLTGNFDDGDKPLKKQTINICGHTHTPDCFLDWHEHPIFLCEMDTIYCSPWIIDEIINTIEHKFFEM